MTSRVPATKPPVLARDFDSEPQMHPLFVEAEVIDGTTPLPAEHAEAVGVVEHAEGAIIFGDLRDFGQPADVPLHRVNALDDDHFRVSAPTVAMTSRKSAGLLCEKRSTVAARRMPSRGRVEILVGEDDVAFWAKVATLAMHER